jgi:hypothetical protein
MSNMAYISGVQIMRLCIHVHDVHAKGLVNEFYDFQGICITFVLFCNHYGFVYKSTFNNPITYYITKWS